MNAMMPPPNMYPGMPAMPMFPGMPPVPSMPEQTPSKNAKSRNNKPEAPGGGGKNQREPKGKRRTKGKNSKDEPSAAIEDDANLSLLLNQVRRRQRDVSLEEVLSEKLVVEFAKDQHGSRFLQTKLDEAPDDVKRMVYAAIQEDAAELSKEVFANHVVQKIFDTADTVSLRLLNRLRDEALVRALADNVAALSQDQYGCRVIQKAIQAVSKESQQQIARELEDHVESCIRTARQKLTLWSRKLGNARVIQKCIEQMPPDSVNFVIKAVEQKAEETARHVYGCRVIQRLLEHCVSAQLEPMLEKILVNVAVLAKDAYGNYVVQHMLEHGRKEDKKRIFGCGAKARDGKGSDRRLRRQVQADGFRDQVVEKCFEAATVGENADDPLIQQELGNSTASRETSLAILQERNLLMRMVLERLQLSFSGFEVRLE
ncbi:APUM3 [Symbiodinium sp. CCMP2592]|nr:APUM3 [Symbiodinium sp. CCMP2592]